MTIAIGYFAVRHSSPDEWARFGEKVLGGEVISPDASDAYQIRLGNAACAILIEPGDESVLPGWVASSRREYDAALERINGLNAEVVDLNTAELADRCVKAGVRFADPDGYPNELTYCQVMGPRRTHLGHVRGFVDGIGGIGHIVIGVSDLDATIDFYGVALGAKLSDLLDRGGTPVAFLHTSPRQHSLAFGQMPLGVVHIMFEVATIDDVGMTLDRALAEGFPVHRGLGRHSNDFSLSAYIASPSGFDVEIGCDAITVSDESWVATSAKHGTMWGHKRPDQLYGDK